MKRRQETGISGTGSTSRADSLPTAPQSVPLWDAQRRELLVDGEVVKRFRVPAPNQIAVLAAFEDEGWPSRVLDPLPPQGDEHPKRRLNETIKALNGHHRVRVIRFSGDGTGQGVLWEWIAERD